MSRELDRSVRTGKARKRASNRCLEFHVIFMELGV